MKILLAIAIFASGSMLLADDLTGKVEVTGQGGGITVFRGGGTHGLFGGSAGYGFKCLIGKPELCKRTIIFGEFDLAPISSAGGGSEQLMDFLGGVKMALKPSAKAEPYVIVGFGGSADRASDPFFGTQTSKAYVFQAGVGERFFVGKNWGIAPEVRWAHYFHHGPDGDSMRYTGGIFYQWGK